MWVGFLPHAFLFAKQQHCHHATQNGHGVAIRIMISVLALILIGAFQICQNRARPFRMVCSLFRAGNPQVFHLRRFPRSSNHNATTKPNRDNITVQNSNGPDNGSPVSGSSIAGGADGCPVVAMYATGAGAGAQDDATAKIGVGNGEGRKCL
jgi:hypothetical protein